MFKKYLLPLILCAALLTGCGKAASQQPAPQTAPEDPTMDILVIGGYGRDCIYYLESLAQLAGYDINAAYLDMGIGTLRDQAKILATNAKSCNYAESNGIDFTVNANVTASRIIDDRWDIIIMQQAVLFAGYPGTYDSDLGYIIDYLKDRTDAKIYWNMAWAADDGTTAESLFSYYKYYNADTATMYNAISTCLESSILSNDAFTDWIPTGAAIQTLRDMLSDPAAVTANGHNLSYDIGRLTAGLTLMKTLYPGFDLSMITADSVSDFLNTSKTDSGLAVSDDSTYTYSGEEISLIVSAVENACALTSAPEKVPSDTGLLSESADITIVQTTAPLKVHFPDLATLSDGTIVIGAYENVVHSPTTGADNMQEGVGRLVIWNSVDNGATWHYDQPLLVIDEAQMEKWGIAKTSGRYAAGGTNYTVMADPRDPNLSVVMADMDGDGAKEEVLLLTFWVRYYSETSLSFRGLMLHSTDGGKTWSVPQDLVQADGRPIMKRGNIAFFDDGQILVPYYYDKDTGGLLMEYDPAQEKWILVKDQYIPNMDMYEGKNFNEISLVVPEPDTDNVYAYCRENGTVLFSDNRGETWECIANQDGLIHQPGFAILDRDNVFVTWSRSESPRTVYGKVFHTDGAWEDTKAQVIYQSPVTQAHDMGDPSCTLLSDGRVLVVAYDTAYRSVVGVYVDPNK